MDKNKYTIAFPLNIVYFMHDGPDKYEALGHEINRISYSEWQRDFENLSKENEEIQGPHGEDRFTDFMDKIPNNLDRTKKTYWKFEIESCDKKFAIDKLERVLDLILGKINLVSNLGKEEIWSIDNSIWPKGISTLKKPFVYIVKENDEYKQFFYNEDISPRKKFRIKRRKKFNYFFNLLPSFSGNLNTVEKILVRSIKNFQGAITDADVEESFLHFWRSVESLTLTQKEDTMNEVINRVISIMKPENEKLFNSRLRKAKVKRNKLVHEGIDISITNNDQYLLKNVIESIIWFYCEKIDDWDFEDFKFFLKNAGKAENEIENIIENLESKRKVAKNILESKRYEESIFEQIYLDWRGKRNKLEDVEFVDTFRFFYPFFGIGNEESDVFIVSDFPVYPYTEEDIIKRDSIPGYRPNNMFHPTIKDYRTFLENIIEKTNPGNTLDIIETVSDSMDIDKDDVYYTTLQKDGRFNEEEDEIDGYDPEELNRDSIEAWKFYLKEELKEVDPKTIIVFGANSLNVINELVDEDLDSVGEFYQTENYKILSFEHWTETSSLDEFKESIKERVKEMD